MEISNKKKTTTNKHCANLKAVWKVRVVSKAVLRSTGSISGGSFQIHFSPKP